MSADAHIESRERDFRLHVGESRAISFAVRNDGEESWPGVDPDGAETPEIRLSYRWHRAAGPAEEGPRTPFPLTVEPGATVVVPLLVVAPAEEGPAWLEVDVVHEYVRWFGSDARYLVDVVAAPELPVEREVRPLRRRLSRRPAASPIPRVIHRVWLGGSAMPAEYERYAVGWAEHHPGWQMRLWTDADAPRPPAAAHARNVAELADIVRYEVLRRQGGVYVDTDVECLRPLDPLLRGVRAFAAYEVPGRLCNAVLGAIPGHPAFSDLVRLSELTSGRGVYPHATATTFLTRVLERHPDVTLFSPKRFYPFLWDDSADTTPVTEETYALHHWAKAWV